MQINNISKIQQYFFEYISTSNIDEKRKIIEACKREFKSDILLIDRLKKIIDNLNNNSRTLKSFINNVFDIKNGVIRNELIENLESQIENKTIYNMERIDNKLFTIISFYDLKKESSKENCEVINNEKIIYNFEEKEMIEYDENDTFFNNYLVEKILGLEKYNLFIAYQENEKYIISDEKLPEKSSSKIIKEESLCETKDIQYFIDGIIGENEKKEVYLKRIFLDLITNQNYRILNNGLNPINSDLLQDDYYVLNGVTLNKKIAISSFLRNYYLEIEDILNLIFDNYNIIIEYLEKIECNENYKRFLINSIKYINEQIKIKNSLDAIESGVDSQIYTESRKLKNDIFIRNLNTLYKSLNSNVQTLTKTGYANIYMLVVGIILCGISIAYLIIQK